jgi:translation initiation factor 5B
MIRQPIVVVLGHVDHGKTSLLDAIRGTTVAAGEPGMITQHIGASVVPAQVIQRVCGAMLEKMGITLSIPGLLFIDSPGHEAFGNLRKRGGSIADIAILVIDINQGVQPQTVESIQILKLHKTPFIVAATKIDALYRWKASAGKPFGETLKTQPPDVVELLDQKVYELVGALSAHGFNSERFDRVEDFTRQVAIIPVSSRTGEGMTELLLFLAGMTQKYMESQLRTTDGPAKGNVLEVREARGIGMTVDAIIYDGTLRVGDTIVLGGVRGPITTRVRGLLVPKPLVEMRSAVAHYDNVKEVHASAGVKIFAPGLEEAVAGSPLIATSEPKKAEVEVAKELREITVSTDRLGVVVKADSLGSLEAIVHLFGKQGIPIRVANVGAVTRRDVAEAESVREKDPFLGVVFAFTTKVLEEARKEADDMTIPVFDEKVVYKLVDDYQEWRMAEQKREREEMLKSAFYPAKFRILPGFVFRSSRPAIVGVEVIEGVLKTPCPVMTEDGRRVGRVKEMQKEKEKVEKAEAGTQLAVSIDGATVGRQISEGDVLFTDIPLQTIYDLEREVAEKELLTQIKNIKKQAR